VLFSPLRRDAGTPSQRGSVTASLRYPVTSFLRALCAFVVKSFLPDLPGLPVIIPARECGVGVSGCRGIGVSGTF
jgi:hypothetical protein